jgi:pimeloyl-ACP methyl ester carboxylesterase
MPPPTIVIVPGLWLGPRPYELLVEEMKKLAPSLTEFIYAPLISTGTCSPGNPTMYDDAMGIRGIIKPLVEASKRLVIVGHSAGAFLSAMATEDLEVGGKFAAPSGGGGGGVERFVFIAGGILPLGAPHPELGFLDVRVRLFQSLKGVVLSGCYYSSLLTMINIIGRRGLLPHPR